MEAEQAEEYTTSGRGRGRFTSDELDNSFPLDQGRRFANARGRELVGAVLAGMAASKSRVRARKAADEERLTATVEALLANLVAGHMNVVDASRFVAVSFSKDYYNGSALSVKAMRDCRDYMEAENLIDIGPGFSRPDWLGEGRYGRRTRMRASVKLQELIDGADLGRRPLTRPADHLVRMKAPKEGIGPAPPHVEEGRAFVEVINGRLANTDITVRPEVIAALTAIEDEGEDAEDRRVKRRYAGDLTATSIYRAFKGDWQSGGRFYGGWWMSFPKALRGHITINGENVVELDYTTLHPSLLYRRLQLDLDFDPYLVRPWLGEEMRKLGKRTFNRLLNRSEMDPTKRVAMRAAPGDITVLPPKISFRSYFAQFLHQVRDIEHLFGTGEGLRLQYEDSNLALSVMKELEASGIVVLPVHDSFIVAEQYEEDLRLAMLDAFFSAYGDVPLIDRKGPPYALSALPPGP